MDKNTKIGLGVAAGVVAATAVVLATRNAGGSIPPAGLASVSGYVGQGDYNTAVAGATVSVGGDTAITDGSGNYSIAASITPGVVTVTVDAQGFDEYTEVLTLVAGNNVINIHLTATAVPIGSVSGYITDAGSGQPISGASVSLSDGTNTATQTTDINGFYQFTGIDAGVSLTWLISKTGYDSQTGTISIVEDVNTLSKALSQTVVQTYGPVFTFGTPVGSTHSDPSGMADIVVHLETLITNNGSAAGRHQISLYCNYYGQPYLNTIEYPDRFIESFYLELAAGASYNYVWDNWRSGDTLYHNYADFWIQDELGNKSPITRITG